MERKIGMGRKIGDFMFERPKRGVNGFGMLLLILSLLVFAFIAFLSFNHTGPFPLPR